MNTLVRIVGGLMFLCLLVSCVQSDEDIIPVAGNMEDIAKNEDKAVVPPSTNDEDKHGRTDVPGSEPATFTSATGNNLSCGIRITAERAKPVYLKVILILVVSAIGLSAMVLLVIFIRNHRRNIPTSGSSRSVLGHFSLGFRESRIERSSGRNDSAREVIEV